MKNYGYSHKRELAEQSEEDFVFGAKELPCMALIPETEREHYLPEGQLQRGKEDTQDCATRASVNILKTKFNYLYQKNLISLPNIKWLIEKGYVEDGGKVNFSYAWVAIGSGTTREGNSLKSPLQFIHDTGLIPYYMLPLEPWMTWADYHNPARITQAMKDLAAEFKERFFIRYEKVLEKNYPELIKKDFLVVAGCAWPDVDPQGFYPRMEGDPNHAWNNIRKPEHWRIFDSYPDTYDGDFIKNLASNYDFLDYGYRLSINESDIKQVQRSCWKRFLGWVIC